ncbi:MAG: O-antigen ligase family protein [Chloroflexota bacterium]
MTQAEHVLKSIARPVLDLLWKFRFIPIAILVIGLGVLLGFLMNTPETSELFVSIAVLFVVLVIIVNDPLHGVMVWLFFTAFLETWINIPMGAGIPDLEFSRFIAAFLAIFMLARAATGQHRFSRPGLVEACIVMAFFGIALAAPRSTDPRDVLQSALTEYLIPLGLYFFTKNLVRDKNDLHKLFWVIAFFGFVVALYAMYEQATGNILFLAKGREDKTYTVYSASLHLLRGLLGRSGNFGRVLVTSIPVSFYLFFESKKFSHRFMHVAMLLVQAFGMFLTYNRTSWYALIISLSILAFSYPQFRRVYLVIVFVAAAVLWATWDQVNESAVVQERVNEKTEDFNGRSARWEAGWNMWQAKPIQGWGFGRYESESGNFRSDGFRWDFQAIENDFLDILVGSGLLGFAPYFLFLLIPLLKSLRLFFRARAPDWPGFIKSETIAVYWAVILSFVLGSYTQVQTQLIVRMLPFAIAGAVVGSHEYLLRRSERRPASLPAHQAMVGAEKS